MAYERKRIFPNGLSLIMNIFTDVNVEVVSTEEPTVTKQPEPPVAPHKEPTEIIAVKEEPKVEPEEKNLELTQPVSELKEETEKQVRQLK